MYNMRKLSYDFTWQGTIKPTSLTALYIFSIFFSILEMGVVILDSDQIPEGISKKFVKFPGEKQVMKVFM